MEGLKPPQQWCMDSANLAESWKTWKEEFTLYIEAEEKARVKLFSGLIGERGRELCGTIIDSDTRVTVTSLMAKLDGLCNKVNETVERYRFFERNQAPGESIDKYVTDLRTLANTCNFEQLKDSLIRDRIVCGSHSSSWRERLLREDTLDLDKCLQICRSMEISHVQVKEEPEEPEEQSVQQEEEQLLQVITVCVKSDESLSDVEIHWSPEPSLMQEVPETLQIKEEPEEQSVKQEEEQLPQFTAVCMKSEEQTEHQEEIDSETEKQTDNSFDWYWEPSASTSAAQMETEADGAHDDQVQLRGTSPAAHNSNSAPETGAALLHTGNNLFVCSVCEKTFLHKTHLDVHMKTHSGVRPYSSACQRALRQIHIGEKPLSCSVCETQRGYLLHKRPYSCKVCKRTFVRKAHLETHMKTHASERPYSCPVCKRTFTQQGYLNTHMQIHTGDRPSRDYSCPVCRKMFGNGTDIKRHMVTHTGEKPYSCSMCGVSFTQKSSLTVHMRRHTGEKPYSCTVCHKAFIKEYHLIEHITTHM